jgi:hypothetical protein
VLNWTLIVMPSRISRMASSGMELERLRNAEGARTYVDLFPDCSPAGGTVAAFDFAERRHVR